MSAFGAPGQLAARGASRRPDAVQAARRNLTKLVRRAEDDRDPSTRAHRALQHGPPNCLRARPPRGRSRCTSACPSAPVRCGCRRPTACESWGLRRWPGAGLSRHTVGAEQCDLCCSRQALDAVHFAASSRAVGHRHRKLELDRQPAGRVAAGDAGTVARKPALEIACPTRVERAVAAAQQIHPGLGHRTTASLRRPQGPAHASERPSPSVVGTHPLPLRSRAELELDSDHRRLFQAGARRIGLGRPQLGDSESALRHAPSRTGTIAVSP
jgi:hypothetical protein